MRETKESGFSWIGTIPSTWELKKGKYIFVQRNQRGNSINLELLSPTQKFGVIPQTLYEELTTMRAVKLNEKADLSLMKTIHAGDYCISLRSFEGGFEYSKYEGVVSPAYQVFYPVVKICDGYYKYLFKDQGFIEKMNSYTMTLRDGKNIAFDDFGNTYIPVPPIAEQECIANYLDSKCAEIDTLFEEIQFEIDTLEEYKKSTIYDAITHGIQSINLVHSESDVWKEIPETWKLVDIKYLFEIVKRIAGKEGFDILAVTQRGLKIKDITSGDGQLADNYSNYQFVYPTDYVMNHMDLLTGWVDCSTMFGVTSPDYRVFRLRDKEKHDLDYYKYVMQCCYMNRIFYSLGQGVSNLGRWRLQTSVFNNFKVPVPPIEEQKAIATYLNSKIGEIDSIIDTKKEQLTTLIDYKKSLIYEYVTGKKEVPEEGTNIIVALEPRMMLLGTIIDKLGKNQKGRIQLQKILYLADMHLGLNRNVQYYRYDHGPYDIHLNDYIDNMVKNGWYQHRNQGGALLVAGKNHADFLHNAKNMFGDKETEIENLLNLLQSMNVLKRTRMERIATLYAAWNDFLLEGITPTDDQIIQEVMTNWTENKGNTKYETWQDSLNKMKTNGLIPKGVGLHTLPKPQKEVADNE